MAPHDFIYEYNISSTWNCRATRKMLENSYYSDCFAYNWLWARFIMTFVQIILALIFEKSHTCSVFNKWKITRIYRSLLILQRNTNTKTMICSPNIQFPLFILCFISFTTKLFTYKCMSLSCFYVIYRDILWIETNSLVDQNFNLK